MQEGDPIEVAGVPAKQHFTKAPPRYSEANLVKTLQEKGIGRPSTYGVIISGLQVMHSTAHLLLSTCQSLLLYASPSWLLYALPSWLCYTALSVIADGYTYHEGIIDCRSGQQTDMALLTCNEAGYIRFHHSACCAKEQSGTWQGVYTLN